MELGYGIGVRVRGGGIGICMGSGSILIMTEEIKGIIKMKRGLRGE